MHRLVGLSFIILAIDAHACEVDMTPVFGCQAENGRKFIELCSSTPVGDSGTLQYRFGSLGKDGQEKSVDLVFPATTTGSMKQFYGATFTHKGVYTQSIRFSTGKFSYTVYTQAQGTEDRGAGVKVRNLSTGKVTFVECNERPRFYIFEFSGKLQCDLETPVGKACIK